MAASTAATNMMAAQPSIPVYRYDAMTASPVTLSQASTHCVMTLGLNEPKKEEVQNAFTTLVSLQKNITVWGEVELKSYVLNAAAQRGIKHAGNPVSSWHDLTCEWRDNPRLLLCKDIYEMMVTDFSAKGDWYAEKERLIQHKLDFKLVDDSHENNDSFVVLILKKCHSNVWKTFGAGRKSAHKVGLTQKRERCHPMGAAVPRTKADVFCFQNVAGWEDLCAKDPVASAIWQKKTRAGSGFFDQDVVRAILLLDDDDEDIPNAMEARQRVWVAATVKDSTTERSVTKVASTPAASVLSLIGTNDPSSVLTKRDYSLRQRDSPAGVTVSNASTATSPTVRNFKSMISAKESSKNADIIRASSMVQVEMAEGQVQTNQFDDLSTMRPSCLTEVKREGMYRKRAIT